MIAERRGYCPDCQKHVLYRRTTPNHILHLILSVITAGLWLPVWIMVCCVQKPFRCPNCGHAISHVWILVGLLGVVIVGMGALHLWINYSVIR